MNWFDDFDTQQQSDEIIPEEYDDWMCFVYNSVLSSNGEDATPAEKYAFDGHNRESLHVA